MNKFAFFHQRIQVRFETHWVKWETANAMRIEVNLERNCVHAIGRKNKMIVLLCEWTLSRGDWFLEASESTQIRAEAMRVSMWEWTSSRWRLAWQGEEVDRDRYVSPDESSVIIFVTCDQSECETLTLGDTFIGWVIKSRVALASSMWQSE